MRGKQERNFSGVWEGVCWICVVRQETPDGYQCKEKVMCRVPCRPSNATKLGEGRYEAGQVEETVLHKRMLAENLSILTSSFQGAL